MSFDERHVGRRDVEPIVLPLGRFAGGRSAAAAHLKTACSLDREIQGTDEVGLVQNLIQRVQRMCRMRAITLLRTSPARAHRAFIATTRRPAGNAISGCGFPVAVQRAARGIQPVSPKFVSS